MKKHKMIVWAMVMVFMLCASAMPADVGWFAKIDIIANAEETDGVFNYSLLSDGTYIIEKYFGTDTEVIIPATFNGKKVTCIGDNVFANN